MHIHHYPKTMTSLVAALGLVFSGYSHADMDKEVRGQAVKDETETQQTRDFRVNQVGEPITASILLGKNVKDAHGVKIGEIEEMVVNRRGRITHALVSFGGIMNIGEDLIPVPWELFSIDKRFAKSPSDSPLYMEVALERLREAPRIRKPGFPVPTTEVTALNRADEYFADELKNQHQEWRQQFHTSKSAK